MEDKIKESSNINWDEIKDLYPDAYNLCCEWADGFKDVTEIFELENDRDLYDFFDKYLIMIEIGVDFTRVGYGKPLFCFGVSEFKDDKNDYSALYRSRKACEKDAFENAFMILEEKLNL